MILVPASETLGSAVNVHFMGNFFEVTIDDLGIGGEADKE
jgi:hypothetical protein